jgi:hypothetical protein
LGSAIKPRSARPPRTAPAWTSSWMTVDRDRNRSLGLDLRRTPPHERSIIYAAVCFGCVVKRRESIGRLLRAQPAAA